MGRQCPGQGPSYCLYVVATPELMLQHGLDMADTASNANPIWASYEELFARVGEVQFKVSRRHAALNNLIILAVSAVVHGICSEDDVINPMAHLNQRPSCAPALAPPVTVS